MPARVAMRCTMLRLPILPCACNAWTGSASAYTLCRCRHRTCLRTSPLCTSGCAVHLMTRQAPRTCGIPRAWWRSLRCRCIRRRRHLHELERARKLPGVRGVCLGTRFVERELSDPAFFPVWERIAAARLPVFLHYAPLMVIGTPQRLNAYHLGNVIGNTTETAIAAAHLVFGGVLDRLARTGRVPAALRRRAADTGRAPGPRLRRA